MATSTEKIVVQVVVKGGKQIDNLGKKTKNATKGANGLTKQMGKMAAKALAAATAFRLIGQVVSGAIKTFTAFEFQMAKVRAISGASNKDFKKLSETAQQLGRTTFFTATQVAELQTNYAKLGFTTKEILNAQEATLLLATATGSDLGRAAIVAGAAVRGFGLDASETTRVVDVMTLSFNSSALDIEKWQTSMTKVAPIAAGMNIELEDTAAIMGTLTDAGIEASIAGTSMRNIFLKMKDSSSDLSKFLGFTVNSSVDLSKALEKLGTASDTTLDGLVNIRQVAAFSVMVKGAKRVEKLTAELRNAKGAAEEAASIIGDTLEGAFKRLTSATQGLAIKLTADLGGGLQDMVDGFANFINKLTDSSKAIATTIRGIIKLVKWVGAMALGIKIYSAAMLASAATTGVFSRALLLARIGATKFTTAINISRVAMKKFLVGSGIGIIVLGLTELAAHFIFAGEAADGANSSFDKSTKALKLLHKQEKERSDFNNRELAKTIEQGKIDLELQDEAINKNKDKASALAIAAGKAVRDSKEQNDIILERNEIIEQQEILEKKRIKIETNNSQIRQNTLKKAFDDDIKMEESRNSQAILAAKQRYRNDIDSKKVFDEKIEELHITHLANMIKVNTKHKEDSLILQDELLTAQIKAHESEILTFDDVQKKIKKDRDNAVLAENQRNLKFIQQDDNTKEDLEKNAKEHSDKIISIETTSFNAQTANAENHKVEKTSIEQAFVDFQLANIDEVALKQKEVDEKTLEDNKILAQQKLEVMKASSDAIFTIMSGNLTKQTERETKKLEEQKDAGIITEEEYEAGVEAIHRKAFERKKRMDIAQAIINGALAMTTVAAQTGILAFLYSPFIAAMTALQIGVISAQQFAKGGMIEEFANGGMVQGKSHAQGGEKFAVGGRVVELEGGEAVINKRSTSMFSSQLSAMNAAGGGVKFADGGLLNQPSFSQQQFNAVGQNQMVGAMGSSGKVVVVEADITDSQNTVSVIQSQATI